MFNHLNVYAYKSVKQIRNHSFNKVKDSSEGSAVFCTICSLVRHFIGRSNPEKTLKTFVCIAPRERERSYLTPVKYYKTETSCYIPVPVFIATHGHRCM